MDPTRPVVDLPVEGQLPSFSGATGWLNSSALTATDLRGKVVLVNFWTYTCINWLRQLPYVRAWAEEYQGDGLVVLGVHTPEFDVEHDLDNVRRAVKDLRVDYPVAIDNDYAIWDAFANQYWHFSTSSTPRGDPAHRFGECATPSDAIILELLTEAGSPHRPGLLSGRGVEPPPTVPAFVPGDIPPAWTTENLLSQGAVLDTPTI